MNKRIRIAAAVAAAAVSAVTIAATAHADESANGTGGKIQVKLLATGVLADGKISQIKYVAPAVATALGASPQTKLNDNVVPTLAIEYFVTPNVSVETICCFTSHHVTGQGSVAGAALVDHVMVLPATLTLKYHLPLPGGIKPYVGAGPALFFYIDERPGATATALGVTQVHMSNNAGVAVQAGIDVPLTKTGLGLTVDAKKYWVSTTAHFLAGSTEVLTTRHKVDPWVVSAGLAYRF
jgi:outer membrane protein